MVVVALTVGWVVSLSTTTRGQTMNRDESPTLPEAEEPPSGVPRMVPGVKGELVLPVGGQQNCPWVANRIAHW